MTSTSPRLDMGICPICCAAIRRLRTGTGAFLASVFCFGGDAIRGDLRFHFTSLANLARGRAASADEGVVSPAVGAEPRSAGVVCTSSSGPGVVVFPVASCAAGVLALAAVDVSSRMTCVAPPKVLSCRVSPWDPVLLLASARSGSETTLNLNVLASACDKRVQGVAPAKCRAPPPELPPAMCPSSLATCS